MAATARVLAAGIVLLVVGGLGSLHAAPGEPLGPEFQVNTYTTGEQGYPAVGEIGGGGFIVLWWNAGSSGTDPSDSVRGQRFDASGAPQEPEFQVNTFTTGFQGSPAVSPVAGGFVVVWSSNPGSATDPDSSIEGQLFDAFGMPVGGQFQVNTYTTTFQNSAAVAAAGTNGFVVVWRSRGSTGTDQDDDSIQGQRFAVTGAPVGAQFQVNTYTTGTQRNPAVLGRVDGSFVVVWQSAGSLGNDTSSESIQAQRFDSAGMPVSGEFQLNTYTTSFQGIPAIGPDGSGGFVVTWESAGSFGTDTIDGSVQARRFDAAGLPQGPEFQVNTYTTGGQIGYSVAADGAGFVVVWLSYGSLGDDQSDRSVQARRFDAAGVPTGLDVQVNTFGTGNQDEGRAAADGAGNFVVVWQSQGGSTGTDTSERSIQARRLEGASSAATTTTTTTTLASFGETLEGRKLKLATKPGRPDKSKLSLSASDSGLTLGRGNESVDDPVLRGGALTIASSAGGFDATHDLVGRWSYVGKVGQGKGYKWKSHTAPIRKIVLKKGKLGIGGRGADLGFDLDDDPNPVRIELAIGGHSYCLEFGGESPQFKAGRLYRAKRAAAPAVCP